MAGYEFVQLTNGRLVQAIALVDENGDQITSLTGALIKGSAFTDADGYHFIQLTTGKLVQAIAMVDEAGAQIDASGTPSVPSLPGITGQYHFITLTSGKKVQAIAVVNSDGDQMI
jgi:hypothetical protein